MQGKGDLIAGGVAAVGSDLDVALLPDGGIGSALGLLPELYLHEVRLHIVQYLSLVDDALQDAVCKAKKEN